ncbi:hypothetical protein TKWG_13295 [Advenella kashmirensis WT001]|uniref:Uncharacterized protein n=1 Tax=Advenella kashmirensis (strain DSM 17095 / LMG 22695 / WT001) TaxID=1036672 RepID=I3UCP5_ADVKW|nr:hypothetical protein [Advenella kashmirensis]AFK62783.1 hypothetical protein TKWG_13295 [Advenella kashmirensis WT001]
MLDFGECGVRFCATLNVSQEGGTLLLGFQGLMVDFIASNDADSSQDKSRFSAAALSSSVRICAAVWALDSRISTMFIGQYLSLRK